MDIFSLEFLILLFSSLLMYYLLFLINKKAKKIIVPQWLVLLIASLLFYSFSNYVYIIYLLGSSLIAYIFAIISQNHKYEKNKKIITAIPIVINVGVLAVLKYYNFFAGTLSSLFHLGDLTQNFIVPLGISFYTFSLIAYSVDCCRGITVAEKNPLKFILFVSYFPKVLQGPISSYDKLKEDGLFKPHSFVDNDYLKPFFRISVGLVKKLLIANTLGLYVSNVFANLSNVYGGWLLFASVLYSIQLFCDFSGFLDISIGVSGLFGIKLEENFNAPYLSTSIQDFWRRWHITLGNWLKKYIYIPLGGNRVPIWRWIVNTLIVWLVSGIWHGANWTFIIWGLYHGVLLVFAGIGVQIRKKKGLPIKEKSSSPAIICLKILLTFLLVDLGWIMFRAPNISDAMTYYKNMFLFWENSTYNVIADESLSKALPLFILSFALIAVLIAIYYLALHKDILQEKLKGFNYIENIAKYSLTIIFICVSIYSFLTLFTIGGGQSSFIYFDF